MQQPKPQRDQTHAGGKDREQRQNLPPPFARRGDIGQGRQGRDPQRRHDIRWPPDSPPQILQQHQKPDACHKACPEAAAGDQQTVRLFRPFRGDGLFDHRDPLALGQRFDRLAGLGLGAVGHGQIILRAHIGIVALQGLEQHGIGRGLRDRGLQFQNAGLQTRLFILDQRQFRVQVLAPDVTRGDLRVGRRRAIQRSRCFRRHIPAQPRDAGDLVKDCRSAPIQIGHRGLDPVQFLAAKIHAVGQRRQVLFLELQDGGRLRGEGLLQPLHLLLEELQGLPRDNGPHRDIFLQDQRHQFVGHCRRHIGCRRVKTDLHQRRLPNAALPGLRCDVDLDAIAHIRHDFACGKGAVRATSDGFIDL